MKTRMMVNPTVGLLAGLVVAFAWPAHKAEAQAALPSPTSMGPVVKGGSGIGPAQPSAPGLPGARPSNVVNKGIINSDLLSPNDQLFDAIDRGDTSAARDAIARGAELDATNAVGQTPIDESVSLGRNAITFLLVTLLHAGGSNITDAQGPMAMPPPNTLGLSNKDERAVSTPVSFFGPEKPGTTAPRGTPRHKTRYYASAAESSTAAPVAAPSAVETTGTPVPSAGFVGFGSSSQ
ncbi:hypothetical protein [Acidisoma sp.]|uniref:hypothetical protein n=1 Tax=Acidisoma sp. TaxID=1872115 RepID=UPI003B00F12E